jgi:hypothetical protein
VNNVDEVKVIMCDKKNIMHEMLKFNSRNTSTNISILNHISGEENHF